MDIVYRSIADMNEIILRNLHKIPHDIDLVVGIPRSGMLPANLIALYLNKPFTDIDSFIDGRIYSSGERGQYVSSMSVEKILIVDDSIDSGRAHRTAKNKVQTLIGDIKKKLIWGVVFATERSKDEVDFYCEITHSYRIFQWNIFHHRKLFEKTCCDIDGVLCPNPPFDDDGLIYTSYIKDAPLLIKPTVKINTLVSCRLEKYRKITEYWLKKNGIEYDKLILLDLPNRESRQKWNKYGEYKGKIYSDSQYQLFIESSLCEAKDIVKIAKKPVFCTENFTMLNYEKRDPFYEVRKIFKQRFPKIYLNIRNVLIK